MMKLYEDLPCDLCGSSDIEKIYKSTQYSSSLGKLDINLVICRKCHFIYQNPQLTQEALDKHYSENSSGNVYREFKEGSRSKNLLDERQSFIENAISDYKISSICDVGGGTGKFLSSLKSEKKIKKFLIEPSNAIDKNTDNDIIKIKKKIEDVNCSEKFDFIFSISSLEHFKNPSNILKNMCSLLNKSGIIFLEIPTSLKPYDTLAEFYTFEHVNHFTYESILFLLNKCGFVPIKIEESKTVSTMRVLARRKKNEIDNIIYQFNNVSKKKEDFSFFIRQKIEALLEKCEKISIYGAGEHTNFLIEKFDLLDKVEYFIDSDKNKWGKNFYNKEIISYKDIDLKKIKNILISSHDFEKEIYETIRSISKSCNIITLYNEKEKKEIL